jgi:hypothetical protein
VQRAFRGFYAHPKSLILAVAAHVEDGAPRPPELDWWLMRDWGSPYAGGWLDWPAGEFARARAARNVYVAMSGFKAAKDLTRMVQRQPRRMGHCNNDSQHESPGAETAGGEPWPMKR